MSRVTPSLADDTQYLGGLNRGRLVLPNADDVPAIFLQPYFGAAIALDVGLELGFPPLAVGLRMSGVDRAAMPEASVDEDRDLGWAEDDVSGHPEPANGLPMNPVAQPKPMQFGTKREFRPGVAPTIGPHRRRCGC